MKNNKKDGQITVGELVKQLMKLDPDLPVRVEGCDCTGPCSGAEVEQYGKDRIVMILRGDT
jgi:hypothetical protein